MVAVVVLRIASPLVRSEFLAFCELPVHEFLRCFHILRSEQCRSDDGRTKQVQVVAGRSSVKGFTTLPQLYLNHVKSSGLGETDGLNSSVGFIVQAVILLNQQALEAPEVPKGPAGGGRGVHVRQELVSVISWHRLLQSLVQRHVKYDLVGFGSTFGFVKEFTFYQLFWQIFEALPECRDHVGNLSTRLGFAYPQSAYMCFEFLPSSVRLWVVVTVMNSGRSVVTGHEINHGEVIRGIARGVMMDCADNIDSLLICWCLLLLAYGGLSLRI
ncbi:hypothetical protein Tco_1210103 [Tanacetum coccineum]